MFCPSCGAGLVDGAKFCNNCGKTTTAGAAVAATLPAGGGFGAAAAPALAKAHREGNRLIVPKANTALPAFCVKCGQPATSHVHRNITWMNPALLLLVIFGLLGIIVLAILQATLGKKISLDVPLCDAHKSARTRNIWIGVALTFVVPIVAFVLAGMSGSDSALGIASVAAIVSFLVGIVLWATSFSAIAVKKVDDVQGEFKVSPEFLAKVG